MALIRLYKDFSDSFKKVECGHGRKLSYFLASYDIKDTGEYVFFANGKKVGSDYTVQKNDVLSVRRIPFGSGDTAKNVAWSILEPISYGVYTYNKNKKAQQKAEAASKRYELTKDDVVNMPYLSGASNTVATGKTQPYVIGTHKFTPYIMNGAGGNYKGYHSIGGNGGSDSYYNVVLEGGFAKQILKEVSSDDVKLADLLQESPQEGTFPFNSDSAFADTNSYIEIAQDGENFSHDEFNDKIVETESSDQLYKHDDEKYEDRYFTLTKDACAADVCILWNGFRRYGNYAVKGIVNYHLSHTATVIPSYSYDYAEKLAEGKPGEAHWTEFSFDQPVFHDAVNIDAEAMYVYEGWIWCPNYPWLWDSTLLSNRDFWVQVSGDDIRYTEGVTFEISYQTGIMGSFSRAYIRAVVHNHSDAHVEHRYSNDFTYDTQKQLRFNAHVDFPFEALYKKGYEKTCDTVLDGSKTYYSYDPAKDVYAEVSEPVLSELTTYYEYMWIRRYSAPVTVRLRRTDVTPDSNIASDVDECFVQYVHSYCMNEKESIRNEAVVRQRIISAREAGVSVLIGLHIKSTASNVGKLSKINVITSGIARTWDSAKCEWTERKSMTSNPASWVLEVLTSDTHKPSKAFDSEIDLESFGEWYEFCDVNGLSYNAVLTSGETKLNVLQPICNAGRGVLYRNIYGKISVAVDGIKENASVILNSQNLISFEYDKEISRLPDGLKLTYIDAGAGYVENSFIIMYDGSDPEERSPDSVIREVRAPGITDFAQAWKYAHFMMNCQRLRPKKVTAKVGNEGFYYTPCDKILVQHESLKIGLGNAEVKSVVHDGTNIIAIELYDALTLDTENDFYVSVQCVSKDSVAVLTKKIKGFEGRTKEIEFEIPFALSSSVVPHAGDILSYGYGADTVTDEFLLSEIAPDGNDGYTLTLVDYDVDIFEYGNMKDYRPVLTQPKIPASAVPEKTPSVSLDEYKSGLYAIANGNGAEEVGVPDDIFMLDALAVKDGVQLTASLVGSGLRNSVKSIIYEVCKDITAEEPVWDEIARNSAYHVYEFNRSTDGYPESDDLLNWRFRAKVLNTYNKESENWTATNINLNGYGTWKLHVPETYVRVSDRTISLSMIQPDRTDKKEVYGTIRHKIQVRRPDIDISWFKPATSLNPYGSETNYKDGTGYVVCDDYYIQTMPLAGQETNEIIDTAYQFKICAYNEAGNGDCTIQNASALCTSIRDIVNAKQTAKEAYITNITALCSAFGFISAGMRDDGTITNTSNYWTLNNGIIPLSQNDENNIAYQGAFRIGGDEQYLLVVPQLNEMKEITGYDIKFKVGNFEITSTASNINGELIIQKDDDSLDRTRITPSGTYFEHRDAIGSTFYSVAQLDVSGVIVPVVTSKNQLLIGNATQGSLRQSGHDFGRRYLTDNGLVYHFDDDNYYSQHGVEDGIEVVSATGNISYKDGKGENEETYTPAILAVAPYCTVAKAMYGNFAIRHGIKDVLYCTVDFWLEYIYAENQTLFDIGTPSDRLQVKVLPREPQAVVSGACTWTSNKGDVVYTNCRNPDMFNEGTKENPNISVYAYTSKTKAENYDENYSYIISDVTYTDDYTVATITCDGKVYSFTYGYADMNYEYFEQDNPIKTLACQADNTKTVLSHIGLTESEEREFSDGNPLLIKDEWNHLGVSFDDTECHIMVGNKVHSFERYSNAVDDINVSINENQTTVLIDELYIDGSASDFRAGEDPADFVEQTRKRMPWGALSTDEKWLIFDAQDPSKTRSNIIDFYINKFLHSDELRNKILEIHNAN